MYLKLYKSRIILYVLVFHLTFLSQHILLSSFSLRINSLMKSENFGAVSSWNAFLVSFALGTLIAPSLGHLILSHNSLILCLFEFVFVHFILESIALYSSAPIFSSIVSILLSILPSTFFHHRHCNFHFWKFMWGHLLFHIPTLHINFFLLAS